MPIQTCSENKKPGWQYGSQKCYTYTPDKTGNASKAAKQKAIRQAIAIGGGTFPKEDAAYEDIAQEAFDSYIKKKMKDKK